MLSEARLAHSVPFRSAGQLGPGHDATQAGQTQNKGSPHGQDGVRPGQFRALERNYESLSRVVSVKQAQCEKVRVKVLRKASCLHKMWGIDQDALSHAWPIKVSVLLRKHLVACLSCAQHFAVAERQCTSTHGRCTPMHGLTP